jgi:tRNA(Ile)-lysidine synthase
MHRDFARMMAALAPFEPHPLLAVAVSGGADSLALALLADSWARARGGTTVALTVDHCLRREAAVEARRVGVWLGARGIAHRILRWDAGRAAPRQGIQARARAARYALLEDWCARHGVLHLLTAHHRDDQAETFLLRLGQGSGLMGLAAMPPLREMRAVRLLRPLLGLSRAALESLLRDAGQDWARDPSNLDLSYARVRLRGLMPELADEALDAAALGKISERLAALRATLDDRAARRLALAARPHAAGFVRLDRAALVDGAAWEGERALARVLGAVGGGGYPPRGARLRRLYGEIGGEGFRGRTLAGCRILPAGPGALLVCREAAAMAPPQRVDGGGNHWDGRFFVCLSVARGDAGSDGAAALRLGALGRAGIAALRRAAPECLETVAARGIPAVVRTTLPALFDCRGLLAAPHLGYRRSGKAAARLSAVVCRPLVAEPLAGPRFFSASDSL